MLHNVDLFKGTVERKLTWVKSGIIRKAYDLGLGRLGFILHFKGPCSLKFK
jgi:hypothetical protein